MTPQQIGSLLGLSGEQVNDICNEYTEAGRLYRKVLAERALDLHEKTLRLADVGSPTAIETAVTWLRQAMISLE